MKNEIVKLIKEQEMLDAQEMKERELMEEQRKTIQTILFQNILQYNIEQLDDHVKNLVLRYDTSRVI